MIPTIVTNVEFQGSWQIGEREGFCGWRDGGDLGTSQSADRYHDPRPRGMQIISRLHLGSICRVVGLKG